MDDKNASHHLATQVPQVRTTHIRYTMLALLAIGTMINYLDRTLLGITAPAVSQELGIDPVTMGFVFSAFSWSYAIAQVPGGIFLDRFGNRKTYFLALSIWSLITMLHGATAGLKSLLLLRFGLGVSQAPCFPANCRVVTSWFPQQERARATATYILGQYLGLACFSPLLFWILDSFGWRMLFTLVGLLGILFSIVWWVIYRDPKLAKSVSQGELDYIVAGGGLGGDGAERIQFTWANVARLFTFRQITGTIIGRFSGNTVLVFFITWYPTYLATERDMGWIKIGVSSAIPFIAAAFGALFGGWASDRCLKKTGSANAARKLPIIIGLLITTSIVGANYVNSDWAVILCMALAFFGQGMAGLSWALVSDIAPRKIIGLTSSLINFFTNLAGIVTPIVIGYIISITGSFFHALTYIGLVSVVGVFSYIFILGDVKRIEFD